MILAKQLPRYVRDDPAAPQGLLERLNHFKEAGDDVLSQIQPEMLQIFGPVSILVHALGTDNAEFCELAAHSCRLSTSCASVLTY